MLAEGRSDLEDEKLQNFIEDIECFVMRNPAEKKPETTTGESSFVYFFSSPTPEEAAGQGLWLTPLDKHNDKLDGILRRMLSESLYSKVIGNYQLEEVEEEQEEVKECERDADDLEVINALIKYIQDTEDLSERAFQLCTVICLSFYNVIWDSALSLMAKCPRDRIGVRFVPSKVPLVEPWTFRDDG